MEIIFKYTISIILFFLSYSCVQTTQCNIDTDITIECINSKTIRDTIHLAVPNDIEFNVRGYYDPLLEITGKYCNFNFKKLDVVRFNILDKKELK